MSRGTHSDRNSYDDRDRESDRLFHQLSSGPDEPTRTRARDELVRLYLPLCTAMAQRYNGRGVEHDDLVQVARLGLVKAMSRYRPGRGRSFAAYAVPTISGELKRHFRDRGWMVRPPRRVQELRANVSTHRAELEQHLGRTATDPELADALGLAVDEVRELARATSCFRPTSIDTPLDSEGPREPAAGLAYDDPAFELVEDRVCLAGLLAGIDQRSRQMLSLRFVDGLTQREIGERLGMTQMQVCRWLNRVLRQLRSEVTAEGSPRSA
ncbi:RNA polymerase sigma-B factor [Humibacillus xanthopallidus]|uniref:RNA polymerase sigma-B factor n=2 Tax=Humibacillus xanthopallidus TaxID=412689 RepID=A0A543HUD8_9MICO|nr:RNA polymerase sigma-B factor [Humibacillus xanthopallidus]